MSNRRVAWSLVGAAALGLGVLGGAASGATGTVVAFLDPLYGNYGSYGGGEIGITNFTGMKFEPMPAPGKVAGQDWQTFCLEHQESLQTPYPFNWTLSNAAHWGGGDAAHGASFNGAEPDPNLQWSDPISPETAYLFTKFYFGNLTGYDYTNVSGVGRRGYGYLLQQAIWVLENEIPENNNPGGLDQQTKDLIQLARNAVTGGQWSSLGNVGVLTLTAQDGTRRQDVLIMKDPTPPPEGGHGYTPGFWAQSKTNQPGYKALEACTDAASTLTNDYCLWNADGSAFNPTTTAQIRAFVQTSATNAANKLSGHLAVMVLNVHCAVDGKTVNPDQMVAVLKPENQTILGFSQISIGDLMDLAHDDLCTAGHNLTTASGAIRSYQLALADVLNDSFQDVPLNWL